MMKQLMPILGKKIRGFTLVELSIVLVIIGMVLVGIVGGKVLIENSRIKAVTLKLSHYKAAMQFFTDKYRALPGDYNDGAKWWPSDVDKLTFNGNKNGKIEHKLTDAAGSTRYESVLFWSHMAASGFINLPYKNDGSIGADGIKFGSKSNEEFNFNLVQNSYAAKPKSPSSDIKSSPASSINSTGYFVRHASLYSKSGNAINLLSSDTGKEKEIPAGPAVSPKDAMLIDKKMDDGVPDSGMLFSQDGRTRPPCSGGGGGGGGGGGSPPFVCEQACISNVLGIRKYILDTKKRTCSLVYWLD